MFSFLRPSNAPQAPKVAEIAAAVAQGQMILLDVREAAELRTTGRARGAVHVPLGLLAVKADPRAPDAALAPGKPVCVYCASGGRSGMAAKVLTQMGYAPVWNIGGLSDWQAGGGQVDRA